MANWMIGVIAGSMILNIFLFVRNMVWKNRTIGISDAIQETNNRLKLAFEMLWGVAQERGVDDKQAFTRNMVMLASVPEEMRGEDMFVKVLPKGSKASKASGHSIGFN